jgi:hypothetical protein
MLKFGHVYTTDRRDHLCIAAIADEIGKRTNGRHKIHVFPGGTLGSEDAQHSGLALGTVDLLIAGSTFLASTYAPFGLDMAPFAFRGFNHYIAYTKSDLFMQMKDGYSAKRGPSIKAWRGAREELRTSGASGGRTRWSRSWSAGDCRRLGGQSGNFREERTHDGTTDWRPGDEHAAIGDTGGHDSRGYAAGHYPPGTGRTGFCHAEAHHRRSLRGCSRRFHQVRTHRRLPSAPRAYCGTRPKTNCRCSGRRKRDRHDRRGGRNLLGCHRAG